MEAIQAVLSGLYTNFLLRDFAGKVVPGVFFAFSVLCTFYTPKDIISYISQIPIIILAIILGFAWTFTLGMQSLAEYICLWNYFPQEDIGAHNLVPASGNQRQKFIQDQMRIVEFLRMACLDEKNQYERFPTSNQSMPTITVPELFLIIV